MRSTAAIRWSSPAPSPSTLVVLEIAYLFGAATCTARRSPGAPYAAPPPSGSRSVWATLQFAFTYAPPLQAVFATEAVPLVDGLVVVGTGVALFAVVELEKQVRLRLQALRAR